MALNLKLYRLTSLISILAVDSKGIYYETVWKVKAYPHGCEPDVKDHLSLFITQISGPEVMCKYSLALLTSHPFDRFPIIQGQKRGSVQFPLDKRQSSRGMLYVVPMVHFYQTELFMNPNVALPRAKSVA